MTRFHHFAKISLFVIATAGVATLAAGPVWARRTPITTTARHEVIATSPSSAETSEHWKGSPPSAEFGLGALAGVGVYGPMSSFATLFDGTVVINGHGPVADINDQFKLEAQLGPFTMPGGTAMMVNALGRWDFIMDSSWTFYAVGGLGFIFLPSSLGGDTSFYPDFGLGTQYRLTDMVALRGEMSHAFTGVGLAFSF